MHFCRVVKKKQPTNKLKTQANRGSTGFLKPVWIDFVASWLSLHADTNYGHFYFHFLVERVHLATSFIYQFILSQHSGISTALNAFLPGRMHWTRRASLSVVFASARLLNNNSWQREGLRLPNNLHLPTFDRWIQTSLMGCSLFFTLICLPSVAAESDSCQNPSWVWILTDYCYT